MATQVVFDALLPLATAITPSTAPSVFAGTTDQTSAVITTAGAVEDLVASGVFKVRDIIFVNYDIDGTPGQATYTVTATSNGSLVAYTIPAGYLAAANNLSDVLVAATARTNLGLAIGTNVQAYDAGLLSIAAATTAADKMLYTTALDVYAVTDLTSFARTLLDDANAATALATLGAQASASIIANTTAAYAGGGTSNAYTATGLTVNSKVSAVIRASTNAVSICKALPGTNTLTVTFSADPGANTTVDYIALTAAQ